MKLIWTAKQKTNSNDKAILEKSFVKESRILIGSENFRATVFFIMGRLGWYSPINQKMTKSWPIRFPSTKFLHPTHKSLTLLCLMARGGESTCIFWNFSSPKEFCYDPPKLRNFSESPATPSPILLITTPLFYEYETSW